VYTAGDARTATSGRRARFPARATGMGGRALARVTQRLTGSRRGGALLLKS